MKVLQEMLDLDEKAWIRQALSLLAMVAITIVTLVAVVYNWHTWPPTTFVAFLIYMHFLGALAMPIFFLPNEWGKYEIYWGRLISCMIVFGLLAAFVLAVMAVIVLIVTGARRGLPSLITSRRNT